jgi:hypothetical protein
VEIQKLGEEMTWPPENQLDSGEKLCYYAVAPTSLDLLSDETGLNPSAGGFLQQEVVRIVSSFLILPPLIYRAISCFTCNYRLPN